MSRRPDGQVTAVVVVAATARNRRRGNEDAIGVDGWAVYGDPARPLDLLLPVDPGRPARVAVTDGIGGRPDGDVAARLGAQMLTADDGGDDVAHLPERFRRTDQAIRARGAEIGSPDMACTAALLVVHHDGAAVAANAGDVRIYQIRDGYLGQLTQDHRVTPDGSAVNRCLGGTRSPADPALFSTRLRPGDRLLLCSDGLHDAVSPEVMGQSLLSGDDRAVAARLVRAALAGSAEDAGDNVTVALITVVGAGRSTSALPAAVPPASVETAAGPRATGGVRGGIWRRRKKGE
ncbi:PP2C family protein-serine/threonine phosphatase [Micromonospora tulbaghiae]|uniref:PP2C family protein-serine/threonine phosphatase n=1 Tax=Micromonospora TaxID=1873 RepID=UPI000EF5C2F5|nr:protein phosphatase 2C domain-containing protein [Micromonospora sp. BL1]RLQ01398.1 hypothetical protein EAD96_23940 [Micromonospora sp. BL1]